jgi:putative ABC transport system permease protein
LPQVKQAMNINSMDDFNKAGNHIVYSLMPITRIHLYSDYTFEVNPPGNIRYVYIFGAVALFILVIACINFINLSTARSARRAKEVGIRKTLGTERKTLVIQFLIESTITVLISLIIALGITWQVLPLFNSIAGKSITMAKLLSPGIIIVIFLIPFVVGILAGSYPALYLSGFNPIKVLKSNSAGSGFKKSALRNALVVFQFTSSIILIISTIVIYNQLNYIQNKKIGFNKDQILIINGASALDNSAKAFKEEVLRMPGVISGTLSSFLPVSTSSRNDNTFSKDAVMDSKNGIDMQVWTVDYDYIKTMGMEMVKGRFFSKDFADSDAVVINETTEAFLGYDNPVGKKIYTLIDNNGNSKAMNIIGVVGNFNYESLRQKIGPLCMRLGTSTGLASFKVSSDAAKKLVPQIESQWKTMAAGMPFSYRFLDDAFNQMYNEDQKIGELAISFSILAILIACLGLFGLATYIAEQRTKEIGIRKVLGASVANVVNMLSKDFIKLVLISSLIAFPVAWWAMHKWLQEFAYRTGVSWWIFLIAAMTALLVALLTVSFQAIKAALSNPVKSLRTE